ncbi:hypothetical protein [Streptomyces hokutonensis]|uniref:hypothetical protein n=1 Tax=Streptomyces hokutonensis TaxID=1306990 RepID=UPI0036CAFE42
MLHVISPQIMVRRSYAAIAQTARMNSVQVAGEVAISTQLSPEPLPLGKTVRAEVDVPRWLSRFQGASPVR